MKARPLAWTLIALGGLVTLAACQKENEAADLDLPASLPATQRGAVNFDPSFFSPEITNPYFPLSAVNRTVLEGEDLSDGQRVVMKEVTTLGQQHVNISGALTTYIEVLAYRDGVVVERTLDYFAQGKDGWVYYFGEDVDELEADGSVLHSGSWKVGWNETEPQKFVPAFPGTVGLKFSQESVAGVAEDEEEVLSIGETVVTPAGTFTNVIHWREYNPLDKSLGEKWLAPGIGIVKETFDGGNLLLTEVNKN